MTDVCKITHYQVPTEFSSELQTIKSLINNGLHMAGLPYIEKEFFNEVLCFSCENQKEEVISSLLRDPRANPIENLPGVQFGYQNALEAAVVVKNINILKIILENDKITSEGLTDAMKKIVAFGFGNAEILSILLNDPRVDPQSDFFQKALVLAINGNHHKIARLLVEDPRIVKDELAIKMACKKGDQKIVKLLLDKECITSSLKPELISIAKKKSYTEIVNILEKDERLTAANPSGFLFVDDIAKKIKTALSLTDVLK